MYQNCCKKCGSISLHTEVKGNNTGLYCDDCGAWVKWLSKNELRAFEYSMRETSKPTSANFYNNKEIASGTYKQYKLNLDKVDSIDDCKNILKFLCGLAIKPLPDGVEYGGFGEVREYFES